MRRLTALAAAVGMLVVLAVPAQAAKPMKVYVDETRENAACGGTVDIIETGWITVHEHKNGKVLENATYHLDVIFTDGETDVLFRDRGGDRVVATEGGLEVHIAGRSSELFDGQNAHIGKLTLVVNFDPPSFEVVENGGRYVDICGQFS